MKKRVGWNLKSNRGKGSILMKRKDWKKKMMNKLGLGDRNQRSYFETGNSLESKRNKNRRLKSADFKKSENKFKTSFKEKKISVEMNINL